MMPTSQLSTIAQLLCVEDLPVNFAKLVGELDSVLERLRGLPHKVSWDCDDVAIFDLPGTRILLGWSEAPGQGLRGILTLSVGPSPFPALPEGPTEYDALASRLVERVQGKIGAPAVLWHQIECQMSAEWVDLLIEAMPDLPELAQSGVDLRLEAHETPISAMQAKLAPVAQPGFAPKPSAGLKYRRKSKTAFGMAANSRPDLPLPNDADLHRLREALYGEEDEEGLSVPMRLAVHAMNATLIMVWLPLGVTAMAHGLTKGEDMRLASRLMVLTGSFAALAQTPFGQQIAAIARL